MLNLMWVFHPALIQITEDLVVHELLVVAGILVLTSLAVIIVQRLTNRSIRIASSILKTDPSKYRFLKHLLTGTIVAVGIGLAIFTIPSLRAISVSLFASAGILAVIIGFASQAAFSNIVSGIFIIIFKPFRINDVVQVGDLHTGVIEDITLRHTVIRNYENRRIIIPNSVISNETLINSTIIEEKTCRFLEVGISYDSDIDLAMKIIRDEVRSHPEFLDYRGPDDLEKGLPDVRVLVLRLSDFSVNLRAYLWAKDPATAFVMLTDLQKSIKERFDREGVEIPFPYRTIVYKNDLPPPKRLEKPVK